MSVAIRQMIQQGAFDKALSALPDFRVLRNDAERLYLRGVSHAALGHSIEALRCAERGAELEPGEPRFHMLLASLLQGTDSERARQLFVHVISLNPNLPDAHAGLANIAAQKGEHAQAESQYRTALRAQADHAPTLLSYGRLLLSINRTDEGLGLINRVLRHDPQNPNAQALAGRALMAKGNLPFARKALDNALALDPEHVDALLFSVQLRLRQDDLLPALHEVGRLLKLRPTDPGVLLLGAELASRSADEASATALLTRLVQHHPRHELGILKLADIYAGKNPGAAAGLLARHAHDQPNSSVLWRALINVLRGNNALAEALKQAQTWAELAPDEPLAWTQLALLAEFFDDFDLAGDAALRATRLDPTAIEAQLVLARAEQRAHQPQQVLQRLATFVDLPAAGQHRHETERLRGRALLDSNQLSAGLAALRAAASAGTLDPQPSALPRVVTRSINYPQLEPTQHPTLWFLLGCPGSGVDALGRFLAAQADCSVLTDRFSRQPRQDLLNQQVGYDARSEGRFTLARSRYLRGIERLRLPPRNMVVDWLPQLDVRTFDALRALLPQARFLIVQRDPRDALVHAVMQASGGPAFADPLVLAEAIAAQTIHLAQILATHGAPVASLGFEQLQASPRNALERLALAMHRESFPNPAAIDSALLERGGFERYLPSGDFERWSGQLADAFALLK